MSTLNVTNLKNSASSIINGILNADGTTTFGGNITFAPLQPLGNLQFLQSGTGAVTRTAQSKLQDIVSVEDFGAVGDGAVDDTAAIQAAIDYVAQIPFSGGKVTFKSTGIYAFTQLVFPSNTAGNTNGGVKLEGNGCVLLKTTSSGLGVLVQGAPGSSSQRRQNSSVRNIAFKTNTTQTPGTGCLVISNSDHTLLDNLNFESFDTAIEIVDSFDSRINNTYIRNSISKDIYLYGTSGLSTVDTFITNCLGEGVSGNTTKTGLHINSGVSGVYAADSDFTQGSIGIKIDHTVQANPAYRPEWLFFTAVLGDTATNLGWDISGPANGIYLTQCWACSCGQNGFAINGGSVIEMTSCIAYNNGQHGVSLTGSAQDVYINGGTFCNNSQFNTSTYYGINIGSGISNFRITNATCSNLSSLPLPTKQGVGIYVNNGTSDNYQVIGNICQGNTVSSIVSLGTGSTKKISDNLGFNPVGIVTPQPTLPSSLGVFVNDLGIDATVYITGGTVTDIELNYKGAGWASTGIQSGSVSVPANCSIRVTYSVAPTWQWLFN